MTNNIDKRPLMTTKGILKLACVCGVGLMLTACQGQISEKSPVHPNMNMDQQDRKEAQEENNFFEDGRSMRQPVEGTVARGLLKEDTEFYAGVDQKGNWIAASPVAISKSFLYRGKERYEVFCTPCHGITGDGKGIIMTGGYGYVPAPTYHQDRLREATDGELYSAIYNGVRTMPSYASQITVTDRWAIVAYIRALQESQNVSEDEIKEYDVDLASLKSEFDAKQEKAAKLAESRKPKGDAEVSAELGEKVFQQNGCQACHSTDGTTIIGPSLKGVFGHEVELEGGTTVTADEDYIAESIANPTAKVVKGFPPVMAPYDYLPENEIKSLIEYLKTLSDN